jgi:hypothetical protein
MSGRFDLDDDRVLPVPDVGQGLFRFVAIHLPPHTQAPVRFI